MTSKKIIREILRRAPGWRFGGRRGSTHLVFVSPGGRTLTAASSPKVAEHTINSVLRDIRRVENGTY